MRQTTPGGGPVGVILAIIFFITVLGLVFMWKSGVWTECRAEGRSLGYCYSLISR